MLAMGRAMISRPRLLLLDEPSMGLAPLMVEKIFDVVRTIDAEGVTILLIEQITKLALETSSRGYVMEAGRVIMEVPQDQLLANPKMDAANMDEKERSNETI